MQRINDTITGRIERPLLQWLCSILPGWVTSDMLTALGVCGAALSFFSYWQSDHGPVFLWLACAGIVLNWFGDSLDGTLARRHKAERPQYGFFLDHMTDTLAMGLIALGVGMSPYATLTCAMAVLLGYYVMVILTMVTSHVTGVFRISFNGLGPTEIRLFIIGCTISAIFIPTPILVWRGQTLTVYDGIMVVLSLLLVLMCTHQSVKLAKALALQDPPRR